MVAAHDLLFGVMALQNGLIDQVQLVAAFQAWTRAKGRPLAEHLAARGDLDADQRAGVEAMVALHLKKHAGDPERSLAALPPPARPRRRGTECAQIIASKVRPTLQVLVQQPFTAHRSLDSGNRNIENIKKDFNRFGISLNMAASDTDESCHASRAQAAK